MSLHCSETEYETLLGLIYDLENEQTRARRGDGRGASRGFVRDVRQNNASTFARFFLWVAAVINT